MNSTTINIIDLESTCWSSADEKNNNTAEIIEIGIVQLDLGTGDISLKESIYITPTISELSPFCTALTGITSKTLNTLGVSFNEACDILIEKYSSNTLPWASYGQYDYNMFKRQCSSFNVLFPLTEDHLNIKRFFADEMKCKPVGMSTALKILNLPLLGRHHSGADDAVNIGRIYHKLLRVPQ